MHYNPQYSVASIGKLAPLIVVLHIHDRILVILEFLLGLWYSDSTSHIVSAGVNKWNVEVLLIVIVLMLLLITVASKWCIVKNWMITVVVIILVTNLRIMVHQTVQLALLIQLLL